jgi:hypothetical protein
MTNLEVAKIFKNRRLSYNLSFWTDALLGSAICTSIIAPIILLITKRLDLAQSSFCYTIPLTTILLIGVKFFRDQKITIIPNTLTKEENIKLTSDTLNRLNWTFIATNNSIKLDKTINLSFKGFLLAWIHPQFFITEKKIGYIFQYESTRVGRLPFFIGLRTYFKNKFKKELYTTQAIRNADSSSVD